MATEALAVYVGAKAADEIEAKGWQGKLFELLLGASGGPKWFILSHLDRLLFGDFLLHRNEPLLALGSSIGSWRHACLANADPVAAIGRMQQGYLYQHYNSAKPSAEEISAVSQQILDSVLGENGRSDILHNPKVHSHIVTARGRGWAGADNKLKLGAAMGAAAAGNAITRRALGTSFQRVIFHSHHSGATGNWPDFNTQHCQLQSHSVLPALHASGAIPFVLTGERDIPGAPAGQYWDGGILDYHFMVEQLQTRGLILYPHFSGRVVPGWFDKFLPWRRGGVPAIDNLVLLCPSDAFIASLPFGKIPDRNDFIKLGSEERIRYWEQCVEAGRQLAEDFYALIHQPQPLAGVTRLASISA